ncbi:hypothetical protein SGLAM104S_05835 [Streptomyces glaucescens]
MDQRETGVGPAIVGSQVCSGNCATCPPPARSSRAISVGWSRPPFALATDAGSFRITRVLGAVANGGLDHPTLIALLLLAGVAGKSAQFPLHTWLPDAMAGPRRSPR